MRAIIEKLKQRASDNAYILEISCVQPEAESLRLGAVEITQKPYTQKRLGEE